jgi:3-mercaptopyruvate sulfurtransferase SseA
MTMKIKNFLLPFFAAVLVTSCQAASSQVTPTVISSTTDTGLTEANAPRIEVHEAKAALDSGAAILVDVRSAESYAAGHAVGAISLPLTNLEDGIGTLSFEKSQWIITYCT